MTGFNNYPVIGGNAFGNQGMYPVPYNRNFMGNSANQGYPMRPYDYMQQANNLYNSSISNNHQQSTSPRIFCQMVTSEKEAEAVIPEMDGSLNIFIDMPHGVIYTKQLEFDGNAPLRTFTQVTANSQSPKQESGGSAKAIATPDSNIDTSQFATQKDIDDVFIHLNNFNDKLNEFQKTLNSMPKEEKKSSILLEDK